MNQSGSRLEQARVRELDREDGTTLVADLGPGADVSVDVLGDTALVVVEYGDEFDQREFDLPDGEAEAFNNNGVVTIEVDE